MSEHKSVASFTPVPVRPRHDGWTAERQIAFIEKLADTNSISAACKYICFCAPGTAAAIPTHPTVRRAHAPARARPLRAQLWQLPSERRRRASRRAPAHKSGIREARAASARVISSWRRCSCSSSTCCCCCSLRRTFSRRRISKLPWPCFSPFPRPKTVDSPWRFRKGLH
jgi:hypothetical protein